MAKEPCPACGSRDNLVRYADGHAHCFSQGCGHHEHADGEAPRRPSTSSTERRMDLLTGDVEAIPNRGLTRETCDHFGYQVGLFKGRKAHLAPYADTDGRLVAQKVRFKENGEKAFTFLGEPKRATLFGQHRAQNSGKRIAVTEGEIDAMALYQALGGKWPVVSIPNGAGGARRDLAKHTQWLERFDEIVLCFDMDEPGRAAVAECVELFSPGKVKVMQLPLKDAGEMLTASRGGELVRAYWDAQTYRPGGICSVSDLREKALKPATYGLPWPWRTMTQRSYGIQRRYIYTWGSGVGTGKTTLMKQLMLTTARPDLLEDQSDIPGLIIPQPRAVGTILFEENPAKTLRSLAGMAIGKRLNVPGVEYTDAELQAAMDSLDGLFFPVDMFGAKDWDSVKANIKYLVLSLGVRDIVLDPLTALVAGEEDERRALDAIMADMSGLVETHDFTLHLVSHLTTPQGTAHEEGGRVLEKHFTGSRAIARWSHAMIGLERDKQAVDEPTLVRGLKDREYGEAVGPLIGLTFCRTTGRMIEVPLEDDKPTNPFSDERDI